MINKDTRTGMATGYTAATITVAQQQTDEDYTATKIDILLYADAAAGLSIYMAGIDSRYDDTSVVTLPMIMLVERHDV